MPGEKEKGIRTDRNGVGETAPTGINHLLVIAIDDYLYCPKLSNCVKDAKDFAHLLWERYQFEEADTYFLLNTAATRPNILNTIRDLRSKVKDTDSLVIYYSGHGQTVDDVGYWIPVDASADNEVDFVSTLELKPRLDAINSFHTFLIADACFSGSLFLAFKDVPMAAGENKRSRWGLAASHSREKALDGTPGENSPFAERLLKNLRNNTESLGIQKLAVRLIDEVHVTSERKQTPVFKPLNVRGDDSGQFVFRLKQATLDIITDYPETINVKDFSAGQSAYTHNVSKVDSNEQKTDILAKLKSKVRECIAQDDLNGALKLMEERIADNRPISNTFLSLKARYSNLRNEGLGGMLYEDVKSVKRASIVHSLLELLDMLSTSEIK
jgi:hypothetical protein